MIKAILFDMGNVLIGFDAAKSSKAFSELLGVPEVELWEVFFSSELERSYTRGEISSEEFYEKVLEHFPSKKLDYDTFARLWNDIFTEKSEMEELLVRLKKEYPLYLISNTNELHFEYVRKRFRLIDHFTKCFPSHNVGHRKPDRAMFEHVLRDIELQADETVFIDDMADFVEAARRLGIHGIQFTSRRALETSLKKLGVQF